MMESYIVASILDVTSPGSGLLETGRHRLAHSVGDAGPTVLVAHPTAVEVAAQELVARPYAAHLSVPVHLKHESRVH